jgi:segregation and condensation protein B
MLDRVIESLIFVSRQPVTVRVLARSSKAKAAEVRSAIERLVQRYADRGIRLEQVGGGWQFRTPPETAEAVRRMLKEKPIRLSRAAMETLAILAYRQPCTRAQVDHIRGVDSGGVMKFLMDRGFIKIIGKKEEPGRPFVYATTRFFLEFFGMSSLDELPRLSEVLDLDEEEYPPELFGDEVEEQVSLEERLSEFIGEEDAGGEEEDGAEVDAGGDEAPAAGDDEGPEAGGADEDEGPDGDED